MIPPSPKARERRRVIQTLDGLVRKLVFARDDHACVRCNSRGTFANPLQAAHIKAKGTQYQRIRFELFNIITLCKACHIFWWHERPDEAHKWLEEKYPGRWDQLAVIAATAPKVDMKELLIALNLEVQALEERKPS